jgi:hypothetical protein
MPFPASERKKYLDSIKSDPNKKVSTIQLAYKDDPRFKVDVYEVELKYLIFNQFNDRIAVEVETEDALSPGKPIPEYTEELEKKIMDFLWGINPARNKETLEDLEKKGQIEAGVVTADGVIVNGNRRAMLLKRSQKGIFKAAILPDEFAGNVDWIRRLETELQFNVDRQLEYEPLAKYLKVKHLHDDSNIEFADIANMMNQKKPEIEKWYGIMQLMDEYLENIGSPGIYTLLRIGDTSSSKEEAFIQTYTQLQQIKNQKVKVDWPYDEVKDARKYQQIMFDLIRAESLGSPQDYRLVGVKGGSEGPGVFADKDLFQEMYEKHKRIVNEPNQNLPELEEYRNMPECEHSTLAELSHRREADWKSNVQKLLGDNFREFTGKRKTKVESLGPTIRIDKALTELQLISEDDIADDDFLDNDLVQNQVKMISKIIEKIKRNFERNKDKE